LIKSGEPLSEIAFACGYRDYSNFARAFRQRFGHAPAFMCSATTPTPVRYTRHERAR
jgi:CheY-like chemotaxis protein